jgi:hypothetical protein
MADALLNNGDDGDIFIYTGGEQEVPRDVRRANIDESVDTVLARAFQNCEQLIEVVGHDKLKKIEEDAFNNCPSLMWMSNMNGVIEIEDHAFHNCTALSDVEFDKLEIIGYGAFFRCESLRSINMPSIRRIGNFAFEDCCVALTDAVFGQELERIERFAFLGCPSLRRIAIPLKDDLIVEEDNAFRSC